ncbi:MAG: response regulator [Gammaproteobacteria bacterium]|nr:response regulator [Gammaproteobacteria bacterium]
MKILLVNTPEKLTEALSATLKDWGFQPLVADDDFQALQLLCKQNIQLIIKDWNTSENDDEQLCKNMCKTQFKSFTYIIALLNKSQDKKAFFGDSGLADNFLYKPFDKASLKKKIDAAKTIIETESKTSEQIQRTTKAHGAIKDAYSRLESEVLGSQLEFNDLEEIVLSS